MRRVYKYGATVARGAFDGGDGGRRRLETRQSSLIRHTSQRPAMRGLVAAVVLLGLVNYGK